MPGRHFTKAASLAVLALCFYALTVMAEPVAGNRQIPPPTKPLYIAMVFYKLAGAAPDFKSWVAYTKEYQDAPALKKEALMEDRVREMQNTFSLISPFEIISLNTTISLPHYNPLAQGFLIESFDEDKVFPLEYRGERFGIIVQDLSNVHWLKMPQDVAETVWALTDNGAKAQIALRLTPLSALAEDPPEYQGEKFWPLRTQLENVSIWSADGKRKLWEYEIDGGDNAKKFFYQGQ